MRRFAGTATGPHSRPKSVASASLLPHPATDARPFGLKAGRRSVEYFTARVCKASKCAARYRYLPILSVFTVERNSDLGLFIIDTCQKCQKEAQIITTD